MATSSESGIEKTLAILHRHTGVDFTLYKTATFKRRLHRRMSAQKIEHLNGYVEHLRTHPAEIHALFEELLVQVTEFFRDPLVFKAVEKECLVPLCRKKDRDDPIRIWVPACSSGEEVYSFAIVLTELLSGRKNARPVQLFGTDINETALGKARAGIYPDTIKNQISAERLERFFEPVATGFKVRKSIRDLCVFARHNLISDPPFSRLDLISCRNLLIYFTPALQRQVFPLFHFALKPHGCLLLGAAETIGAFPHLFEPRDKSARLFVRKNGSGKPKASAFPPNSHFPAPVPAPSKTLLKAHSKPLPLPKLRKMVEKALPEDVELAPQESVLMPLVIPGSQEKVYVVVTEPRTSRKSRRGSKIERPDPALSAEVRKLRQQLLTLRESLSTAIEQSDAMNEELRAANEEIVSSNEELQSTNEELESAKEELQSANEELATINSELEHRNAELEHANVIASRFQAIVTSSDDAIISKDLNGIIQTWNEGAEKIFGYKGDEVIGKPVAILIPPDRQNEEPSILAQLAAGRKIDHYETIRRRKDGTLLNISLSVSPIRNAAGQIIGAAKIARDITARKHAEEEILRAREAAEKANRAKDNFLAILSHELRTPLTPVLLVSSEAAKNPELPARAREDFELIRGHVELEVRLIDDLLDLSRITAGKLRIEMRPIDPHQVVLSAIAMVREEIARKNITLTENFTGAAVLVMGDTVRLHQIFWNVLRNAAKFTPADGSITVDESCANGRFEVTVTDTGIGMDEDELAQAFDAFSQGHHSRKNESYGGLGLGLTISKRLVDYHGGKISASSPGRGRGSSFTIELPLVSGKTPAANHESAPIDTSTSSRHRRILLVEDHTPTRSALVRLLGARGYEVKGAASCGEAIAHGRDASFDFVISDIGLPDGDGYGLFKELRRLRPAIAGIALTGFGMDQDRTTSNESGFQIHLTKPVRITALERALSELEAQVAGK